MVLFDRPHDISKKKNYNFTIFGLKNALFAQKWGKNSKFHKIKYAPWYNLEKHLLCLNLVSVESKLWPVEYIINIILYHIKQGNRGYMPKIHVTRQFFEASGGHCDLFEKTKIAFLDKVNGSICAKVQVCIVFRYFEEIPVTAASLEKLPCHVDFPHISSSALFF